MAAIDAQSNSFTANVAVPTTTETVVVSAGALVATRATVRAIIIAWCQLMVGTGATSLTPRIRRGTAITSPLVGEGNAQAVTGAAGSAEAILMIVAEELSGVAQANYSLTVEQAAATADGTALSGGILVLFI